MTAEAVLVVGPSWVGDMVMAQSLFMTLARERPGVPVDVLAPGWSLPVIARMPEVRAAIEMPLAHGELKLAKRRRLGRRLRERGYSHAIVLPRSFKAALVPFYARIRLRTGYRGEMRFGLINDMRALDRHVLSTTVARYVALGLPAGAPLPPPIPHPVLRVDPDNQRDRIEALGLAGDMSGRGIVGLVPGAEYGPAKQWPPGHFAALAKRLRSAGWAVWIFGSDKDRATGEAIVEASDPGVRNLCGRTALADVIDLVAATDTVVSNDSGLMHIAASTGRRLVAIYGSSSPLYTPPLTDQADIRWLELSCSPCFARTCRFGHYRCLHDIAADDIASAILDR